jgi:hypothetical protein
MTKVRKSKNLNTANSHWVISESLNIEGRLPLVVGREFRVKGERGRFRFLRAVYNPRNDKQWIDATHINKEKAQARSFSLDRVKVVHRKIHGRPSDA